MQQRNYFFIFIIVTFLIIFGCASTTPLIKASASGDSLIAKKLISEGANINQTDSNGATPLIYAVQSGNLETVRTLLIMGADINKRDNSGSDALVYATYYGYHNVAKLLFLANQAMKKGGIQDVKKVCNDFQEDTIIMSKGLPLYDAYLNYRFLYPRINYMGNKKISIIVNDQRPYVLSKEKAAGYVGLWRERGLMRPYVYNIGTLSQKPLSDDLTFCVSEALSGAGFSIINNFNQTKAQLSYAKTETTLSNADRIINVDIIEWITDTYDATGLYYNVNISIYDKKNKLLVTKHIKGEDNLGGSGGMTKRFIYELVPAATENILSTMFNAPDVMSALIN